MIDPKDDDWDKELGIVEQEIEHIREAYGRSRMSGKRSLIARKVGIIQGQLNLERNLERIKKLVARDYLLLPRERSLLHWGQIYSEKVAAYFQQRTKLSSRSLWLKLIRTRLTGPERREGAAIEPDDLVSLSIRQANLKKTERYLIDALVEMRKKRHEMQRRHAALGVSAANREAAYCLSARLGENVNDALNSPTVRALAMYVRQMLACGRSEQEPNLEALCDRTEIKARMLVEEAHHLVLERTLDPEPAVHMDPRALGEFQMAMEELDELEADTRAAYQRILGTVADEARPILVQKRSEHVNT